MFIRQGMRKVFIIHAVLCLMAVFLSIKLLNGQEKFGKNAGVNNLIGISQERDEKIGRYGLEDINYPDERG